MINSLTSFEGPLFSNSLCKPYFLVDADDVTYQFIPNFDEFLKSRGVEVREDDFWRGLSREENRRHFLDFLKGHPYLNIPFHEGVLQAFDIISIMYSPVIVTARGKAVKGDADTEIKDTLLRLKNDNFPYYKIIFEQAKGDLAKKLNFVVAVEDSPKNALDIKEKSPDTRTYLVDKKYNQFDEKKYGIIRVESLLSAAQIELKRWYSNS